MRNYLSEAIGKLVALRPDENVNDIKHAFIERIGSECEDNQIPFFLEFVGYEEGADEKGLDYAKKKPEIVIGAMKEFTKDRYGVEVLKVEHELLPQDAEGKRAPLLVRARLETERRDVQHYHDQRKKIHSHRNANPDVHCTNANQPNLSALGHLPGRHLPAPLP